jgi:H+/gluconate symporter-like permease
VAYELAVLLAGFLLLTLLVVRGASIFVAAPLCAALILGFSGVDPTTGLAGPFMTGFSDYMRQFYLIFAFGAAFGKIMETSGGAMSIAEAVVRLLGTRWACLSVVLACAVLTYGGVSLFVVGFAVYPLAVQLFRQADLPRRFIPGAIAFGSITFTMTSAGSPEIQNLIPIRYLLDAKTGEPLTDAMAGWPVSLIVAAVMFALGQLYLEWAIARDRSGGAHFEARPADPVPADSATLPDWRRAALPLVVTLVALNALPLLGEHLAGNHAAEPARSTPGGVAGILLRFRDDPALAILTGTIAAGLLLHRYLAKPWHAASEGFTGGLIAIGCTASVVGFGTALRGLPAFQQLVDWVTHLPGDPLVNAALAVAVIAGIAGSASGGQGLALPIIKPIFIDQLGVAPRALHRVVAIASGSLDSMPANGYVVMLVRNICGETHARAYGPVFVLSVLIPLLGTGLAILLFKLVPAWGQM